MCSFWASIAFIQLKYEKPGLWKTKKESYKAIFLVSNAKVHTSEFKCTKKHLKNACLSEPENEITEKHTEPAKLVGQLLSFKDNFFNNVSNMLLFKSYVQFITYSPRVELRNCCRILFIFFFSCYFTRAYFKSKRLKWPFSSIWQDINFKKNIALSDHSEWGWSAEQ